MPRSLKAIAEEINSSPALGLKAVVTQSWSSTDQPLAGTRFRRPGKGRKGLRIRVQLLRNGEAVCDVDTSETYRSAKEVEEWLANWKIFQRRYKGVAAPRYNQSLVEGELQASRGQLLTAQQLKALPDGAPIWVRIKTRGEDYAHVDDVYRFDRLGTSYTVLHSGGGVGFDLATAKGSKTLSWTDGNDTVSIYRVRLKEYKYV